MSNYFKHLLESASVDMDAKLKADGWEETGGIGLYSHKKYPNITVDTNTGNLWVHPVREKGPFNYSEDDFLTIEDTYEGFKRWMKKNKEWVSSKLIDWNKRYMKTLAKNAKVGSKIVFKDHQDNKIKSGKLVSVSNSGFAYVSLGDDKKDVLVSHLDIYNLKYDSKKKEWSLV